MTGSSSAQDVQTTVLPWGVAKWLITADQGAAMSLGEVVVLPGRSHEWHVHEDSDEVVYVLAGRGAFTVGEGNRLAIAPGDALHIPAGVYHDSHNQGWAPLHLLVMYSPAGPELAGPTTAYAMVPAGVPLAMSTSVVEPSGEGGSATGN